MAGVTAVQRVRPERTQQPPGAGELVSVVIPCFNYAAYLPAAVRSVLGQEGTQTEVIVVDDASTDGSLSAAGELAAADNRVTVIAHRTNSGPVKTFNDGVAAASGAHIVRLDADDLLTPGSLARALDVFRAYPSVGLVYGRPVHFSGLVPERHRGRPRSWTIWPGHEWLARRCAMPSNVITAPEAVIRASSLRLAGAYQRELRHTHDFELWLRLAAVSDVGYVGGADQAWHRIHSGSLSSQIDPVEDLRERRAAFDALFEAVGTSLPGPHLRARAMRALAEEAIVLASREWDRGRGASPEASAFRSLASELVLDPTAVPGWDALERRASRSAGASRILSVWPRVVRRAQTSARSITWRQRGVF